MIKKQPMNNFFCVGAQKAGTSTLHDILKQGLSELLLR
jgi:hypothetical protein